ncbi:MAG: hypothetical protein IT343_11940 [Candidatus Melainabacteria bacterium]|nr:hypothetical protein [Candidatus Melainabacteria bacterium]
MLPDIPDTFPFHSTQLMSQPLDCLFDIKSLSGRCLTLETFENSDDDSKIYAFSLMIVDFTPAINAHHFMDEEEERLGRIGTLAKLSFSAGERIIATMHTHQHVPSERTVFYSILRDSLVHRIAVSLSGCDQDDDGYAMTEELVTSIMHMYRNVNVRT